MKIKIIYTILIFLICTLNLSAQEKDEKWKIDADFRFRIELDRNSKKSNGLIRDDRDRLRYRLRAGFKYELNDRFEVGGRLRSGNPQNQQSPHVTLGKEFEGGQFSIDKAYIKYKSKSKLWIWVGKNSMPFWTQNEMLWDDDVNPEGVGFGSRIIVSETAKLLPKFGFFIAGHSSDKFENDNILASGQVKFEYKKNKNLLELSGGLIYGKDLRGLPDDISSAMIDFNLLNLSAKYNVDKLGLDIGFDFYKNLHNYRGNNHIVDIFEDQKMGFVASMKYKIKFFQLGYNYAHIEKYAVIDYFAQDDWVRWGTANYTRSSNFKGHEFRLKYIINEKVNIVLRTYLVKGVITSYSDLETGTRFRLDVNAKI